MEISEVNLHVDIISVANKMYSWVYLLVTEFEVHTASYGSSFFPLRFMAHAKDEVTKIFCYISIVYLTGSGTILFMNQVESKTS